MRGIRQQGLLHLLCSLLCRQCAVVSSARCLIRPLSKVRPCSPHVHCLSLAFSLPDMRGAARGRWAARAW